MEWFLLANWRENNLVVGKKWERLTTLMCAKMTQWASEKALLLLFLLLSTEGYKISSSPTLKYTLFTSDSCKYWRMGGNESVLLQEQIREYPYVLQAGKNGEAVPYTLVWGSSFLQIFLFWGKDEVTLLKQKLPLCTPTELLPTAIFMSCSCSPAKCIIDQSYEKKSVEEKKTTIIPNLAKKCSVDSNYSLIL